MMARKGEPCSEESPLVYRKYTRFAKPVLLDKGPLSIYPAMMEEGTHLPFPGLRVTGGLAVPPQPKV